MTRLDSLTVLLRVLLLLIVAGLLLLIGWHLPDKQIENLRDIQRQELTATAHAIASCTGLASAQNKRATAISCLSGVDWPNSLEYSAIQFEHDTALFTHPDNVGLQPLTQESPLLIAIPFAKGDIRGTVYIKGSESFCQSQVKKSLLPFQVAMGTGLTAIIALFFITILKRDKPTKSTQTDTKRNREKEKSPVDTEVINKTSTTLTESDNLLWSIIESGPAAVVVTTAESVILEWSGKAEEILGWSKDEVLGQKLSELIIPDQLRDAALLAIANYKKTGKSQMLNKLFDSIAQQKNGTNTTVQAYLTEIEINGKTRIVSFILDISGTKKLEADLNAEKDLSASLLNGLPLMVSLKNEALQFTFINDRACEVLGRPKEVLLGRQEKEVFDEDWVEDSIALDRAGYDGLEVPLRERIFTVDGKEEKYVIGRYQFSVGQKNPSRYLLTYGFNITQLKKVQAELEEALKAKDEFLATVSHEIRTPLHSIIVLASLLNREDRKDETEYFAQNIHRSSQHLLELVNDILDFSKAEAGKLDLDPTPLDLEQFMETLTRIDSGERHDQVSFHKISSGCEGLHVLCDSTRLGQVINNLISNAFKFTEKGDVTLSLHCTVQDKTATLAWSVKDTGIGISPDNTDLIKEAFQQAHTGIARKFGGTGLGLGIVMRILNLMESDLEIESELGKGAEFKFTLTVPVLNVAKTAVRTPQVSNTITEGLSMLYVEDMVPNQMVMQAMCKPWNINLTIASSGPLAIEILQSRKFDLILMDIQMPGMDGIETLNQMKLLNIPLPQIHAFTAHGGSRDHKKYIKLGFSGVLEKPITPLQLEEFLKSHNHDNQNRD